MAVNHEQATPLQGQGAAQGPQSDPAPVELGEEALVSDGRGAGGDAGVAAYYRYESGFSDGGRVDVYCRTFYVLKRTPRGVQLDLGFGQRRFVKDDARKRFACPTKEEALLSFRARKRRQIKILRAQLERAELALQAEPDERDIFAGF